MSRREQFGQVWIKKLVCSLVEFGLLASVVCIAQCLINFMGRSQFTDTLFSYHQSHNIIIVTTWTQHEFEFVTFVLSNSNSYPQILQLCKLQGEEKMLFISVWATDRT